MEIKHTKCATSEGMHVWKCHVSVLPDEPETCHVPQVIEKHYGRSLGVWSEKATVLSENGTEEDGFSAAEQHPDVVIYWSLSVAIFSIGGMLTSFLVGFVGDLRGR